MTVHEPFDVLEIRAMSSAQIGEFLGLAFGLRPGMRLVAERETGGEVLLLVEQIASRTHVAATCDGLETGQIFGGTLLRRPAGWRPTPGDPD